MFPKNVTGLSFTKILSGISKTLGIANQIIPIYNQAKPMISNSKKIYNAIKEIVGPSEIKSKSASPKEFIEHKKTANNNLPVFFS